MAKWTKARIDRVRRAYDEYRKYAAKAMYAVSKIDIVMQETDTDFYPQMVDSDGVIYLAPRESVGSPALAESYTLGECIEDWGNVHRKDVSDLIAYYEQETEKAGYCF